VFSLSVDVPCWKGNLCFLCLWTFLGGKAYEIRFLKFLMQCGLRSFHCVMQAGPDAIL
jgi:hypothetical protein